MDRILVSWFKSLADAQTFFTDNHIIDIGFQPGGFGNVELIYDLTGSQSPPCGWLPG
jgi:hypothetical protein